VIAKKVALSVLLPLFIGIGLHAAAPRHSARAARAVGVVGWLLLVAFALPALIVALPRMRDVASVQGLAIVGAYAVCTLVIGHLLGGPEPESRRVLALSTTLRHPGVALALAQANFAHVPQTTPAILLCLLVTSAVSAPYVTGSRRRKIAVAHVTIPH
jgi:BASS family bile acid:Na+ symporter